MEFLIDLYRQHQGKVSHKWDLYLSEYERLFSNYKALPVCLLEIGVQNGGSLEVWNKYFTNSKVIVGCDVRPDCASLFENNPRISVVVGDVNNETTTDKILNISPHYDIIIDDGSHLCSDVIKSFSGYFRHLAYGGMYIVEDMHCSYWQTYEGGLFYPYSSMHFFRKLADVVNHEHWGVNKTRTHLLQGFSDRFGAVFREPDLAEIHSVEFINSICVIRKDHQTRNLLGKRIVSGSLETVASGHYNLAGSFSAPPPQTENPWSTRLVAPEEDWETISNQLNEINTQISCIQHSQAQQDKQINSLQNVLAERDSQIDTLFVALSQRESQIDTLQRTIALRNGEIELLEHQVKMFIESNSWKATRPLRSIFEQLRKWRKSFFTRIA